VSHQLHELGLLTVVHLLDELAGQGVHVRSAATKKMAPKPTRSKYQLDSFSAKPRNPGMNWTAKKYSPNASSMSSDIRLNIKSNSVVE
jgi:hypothetical protein